MNDLEKLIYEALQKFPSEDIRDLVAKETGLTVEQVSEKMNEAAKAAGISFPADTFANIKVSKVSEVELKQSWIPDLDGDGESNTKADRKLGAQKVKEAIDTDSDNKITYKVAVVDSDVNLAYTRFNDLTFEEKTVEIGTSVEDITPEGYEAYSNYTGYESYTNEYITIASDLDYYRDNWYYVCYSASHSSHADFCRVSDPSDTFVVDGTVIILRKEY